MLFEIKGGQNYYGFPWKKNPSPNYSSLALIFSMQSQQFFPNFYDSFCEQQQAEDDIFGVTCYFGQFSS